MELPATPKKTTMKKSAKEVEAMQQLQVIRLTPQESLREQEYFFDQIPERAKIRWICQFLGKSDRTLRRYRVLLLQNCAEYQQLACLNGIDNRILLRRQIELLQELSELIDTWNDVDLALTFYGNIHPSP